MSANSVAFASSASRSARTDGMRRCSTSSTAAMFMAVGKVSFDDCDMLTWSFGWMGDFVPISQPQSSMARLEITSFTFMFVCVPEPVCQTKSGKWSSSLPAITSSAASTIGSHVSRGILPRSQFTSAAAFLSTAIARITAGGIRSSATEKWCSDRSVCAPQYRSRATRILPMLSLSTRCDSVGSIMAPNVPRDRELRAIQHRHDLDVTRVREEIHRRGARQGVATGLQQADVAAERRRVARDEHHTHRVGGDDVLHDLGAEPGPGRVGDYDVGQHRVPPGDVGALHLHVV